MKLKKIWSKVAVQKLFIRVDYYMFLAHAFHTSYTSSETSIIKIMKTIKLPTACVQAILTATTY